eukprot:85391_1
MITLGPSCEVITEPSNQLLIGNIKVEKGSFNRTKPNDTCNIHKKQIHYEENKPIDGTATNKTRSEIKTILNRPPLYYTQYGKEEEYVVFGYLRAYKKKNSLLDINIMKLCLKYYYCVDMWSNKWSDKRLTINKSNTSVRYKTMSDSSDYLNAIGSDIITYKQQRLWKLQISNEDMIWPLKIIIGICKVNILPIYGEFTNSNNKGYGLCDDGCLYHACTLSNNKFIENKLQHKDIIVMHLDMLNGKLTFSVNDKKKRVAFENIDVTMDYCLAVSMCCPSTKVKLLGKK